MGLLPSAGVEWAGVASRGLGGPDTAASAQPNPGGVQPWPSHTWNAAGVYPPHSPDAWEVQNVMQKIINQFIRSYIDNFPSLTGWNCLIVFCLLLPLQFQGNLFLYYIFVPFFNTFSINLILLMFYLWLLSCWHFIICVDISSCTLFNLFFF